MSFSTVLIANRGEIACRVMRSARALGYKTVAVYSDADALAPHVQQADCAVRIGPAAAAKSYLNIPALLAAAQASGADAVHPGYGFLSERAEFAQACLDAGLTFIGPSPAAITAMGDKARAKQRMRDAGVPCVRGYLGAQQDDASLQREANALGYPLLVKATAGGGGRGMRMVHAAAQLPAALAGARREALAAFGEATLMLERLVLHGRHIEVQVFGDAHGQAIHLGERDCTAQRRRQKVIEEAPSPIVDAALRERLGRDAVAAAKTVGYVGAGTVEFIVDEALNHYFLEMNTRLQVEHTVTECITGLDLVAWQLRIAAGEPLPLTQEQVRFSGHAIQARLYTEDPYDGFKPQTGTVLHWRPEAALADGVRIDHGLAEGSAITPWYDAMVAKIIVHGRDRADAQRRLAAALQAAPLLGLTHNGAWLRELLLTPEFSSAGMHTRMLDEWAEAAPPRLPRPEPNTSHWVLAAAALALRDGYGQRPASVAAWDMTLACAGHQRVARVRPRGVGDVDVSLDGQTHVVTDLKLVQRQLSASLNGVVQGAIAVHAGEWLHLALGCGNFSFEEVSAIPRTDKAVDPRRARAPVAGTVAQVAVQRGDRVEAGTPLVCVEAMKMEMWQHAAASGRVAAVHVAVKDSVGAGTLLIELELDT